MKRILLYFFLFLNFHSSFSQSGVWTWISGDSTANAGPVYGTQGIPSVNNHPAALYEYAEWKDKQGNFWLYGGMVPAFIDLWKYNPVTNEWTWVKGPGSAGNAAVFGTKGVGNIANTPGQRTYGVATWVDTTGNFWLFSGKSTSDLWKYDIGSNEWTWMSGDSTTNNFSVHGTKGISSASNVPGARQETCSAWTDSLNNLWLFGGYGVDEAGAFGCLNDLMKYNISTNEWTWMSGSILRNAVNNYGVKGIPSPTNVPGGRQTYTKWKDQQGNFWLMGGSDNTSTYNDVWKYDVTINEWTWMAGPSSPSIGVYQSTCLYDSINLPSVRMEHRSSVTDNCGRFWLFGGTNIPNIGGYYNDLWLFDPMQLKWNWLSGSNVLNQAGNYGSIGVPSVSNMPPSRSGAVAWWGNDNRFYMFGGIQNLVTLKYGALWVFTPDTSCVQSCAIPPQASFISLTPICPGTCATFSNLSTNATTYQWNFAGATPSTSTDTNPTNICYNTPGGYDVQLIATNANGSDTLLLSNYIIVYPYPPPQGISQNGDTLYANAGAVSYQWYYNSTLITGATNYFYVAQASGDYNVVATDGNGCEVEAAIFNVIAGIQSAIGNGQFAIYPNPVIDKCTIHDLQFTMGTAVEISIWNVVGEKVYESEIKNQKSFGRHGLAEKDGEIQLDVTFLERGIYFLKVETGEKVFQRKLVKV